MNFSLPGKVGPNSGAQVYLGATGGLEQTYYFDNSIFAVQSGLEYDYVGVGSSLLNVTVGGGTAGYGAISRSNANYLSIPLHLKGLINERWGALAGVSYRFGVTRQQSGSGTTKDDISVDAGFYYKFKNMRFNLVYAHGLMDTHTGYQMIQSKNRTITFSVSTPLLNL